jgi:hypothetical protein
MKKQNDQAGPRRGSQLPMAFTTRPIVDQKQRDDIIAQLSRLLLQVARTHGESEGGDERS